MAVASGGSSSVPSLPPPCPKSPPEYPDLYGKRREMAKVMMLEREIGFLEVGYTLVEIGRVVGHVASGSGSVKDPVSTSHGFAVVGAHFILKCRGAVTAIAVTAICVIAICVTAIAVIAICVTAIYAAAIHVSAVHCQSGNVAVGPARIALRRLHAAGEVAFFNVLHAPVALAADGNALGLNAQSSSTTGMQDVGILSLDSLN
ncbi:hypothetical protein L1049_022739 [Liquidambar formosana]|uniref:Uncharacterized protein n=1 Tax=Liquidambar formosana TaxID=63359 RepID=A0AAP0RCW9_LIQFO